VSVRWPGAEEVPVRDMTSNNDAKNNNNMNQDDVGDEREKHRPRYLARDSNAASLSARNSSASRGAASADVISDVMSGTSFGS